MLKAVIFDVDGTLVDSVKFHAQAWVKAFQEYGYKFPYEEIRKQIGKGGDYIIQDFISQEEFEQLGEKISQYRKEYYQDSLLPKVEPFSQVKELFARLREDGLQVVLASSGRKESIAHYQKLLNIEDLIDNYTCGDDVEKSKPNPDIFTTAMEKLENIKPEEAIVIGDSPYDAQAALKVPLRTVGVLCGGFSEEVLREAGCIAIYEDPADILAHYEQSPLYPA